MKYYKLAKTEEKFAELIWQNEPIGSGDLVKLSEKEMMTILVNSDQHSYLIRPLILEISRHRSCSIRPKAGTSFI